MMAELRLDLSKIDSDLEAQYDDQDDMPDDDEECVEDLDPLVDNLSPDDLLSPLEKLQKYFQSDDVGERDIALRIIPDAVQCVSNFAEFDLLLDVVFALASDYEPCIRINVLANLSPLLERNAVLRGEGSEFAPENEERLFGIPVKMLVDINLQVRRASQNFVVSLLEDERGNKGSLLSQLCPMIKRCLGKDENYDLRMDTVLMLGRIAGILGRELIVEHFVPLLPSLALDTMFHVRKAYVMSCRELCPVLGEDDAEEHLLPLFFKLCKDDVWGVRKACADVFTDVSASCNLGTRHDKLTPVYLSLLHDDSRWVRKAAFQSLGAFISTFHVPGTSPDLDDSLPPLSDSFLDTEQLSTSSTGQSTSDPSTTSSTGQSTSDPTTTTTTGKPTSDPSTTGNSTSDSSSSTGQSTSDPSTTTGKSTSDPSTTSSTGKSTSDPSSTGKSTSDPSTTSSTGKSTSDPSSTGKSTSDPSGTGKSTSDPSIVETRHTESTNANVNSNIEDPQEEVTFVPSEIARTSSQESLEKSLQDMTVEDLELLESSPLDKGHDIESSPLDKGHDLCADESEENDILDSAIKKIGVQSPLTLDEPLVIHPPPIKSVKLDGEAEAANNETDNNTRDDMHSQSDNNGNRGPILVGGEEQTPHPDYARPPGEISKHSRLVELLQDDNARIRCSSEGSSFKSYFDPVLRGEMGSTSKKRRWSLDKNNTTSQVRVFIHSVSGKVMEQDLSDNAPLSPDTPTDCTHNATTTNSVAMDITLDGMESIPCDPNMFSDFGQEVVPDELMESYLSMTEQVKAQVVDTDLPYYCAYSLAGVALTLGQEYWDIVRPTFSLLASDMQWRIRRVLSFCLHELAKVVGEERMVGDILPVFEEYCTKDIDDVKIGALSHLAEFFELLPTALRSRHLPAVLHGLQDMENEKNWRYRNLLAEQLVLLCDLFDCEYLERHVYPVALALAEDKVAEVRATATLVLGVILQKLSHMDLNKCRVILHQLRSYGSNDKWLYRLMYVKQCETFLLDGRISCELFASECLPILLQLARDKVPNVRIAVARMIKESVLKIDYFQTENKDTFSLEELQITLECLQHDQDRDVKFFAGGEVSDTRRLLMLPVQWYAQRQRSESNHSHNSNEQYQDALEDQSDSKPRPLSLTMAGVLVKSLQNHKKSPTTNYGSVDAPKTDENATQDTAVKSEEGPQNTTQDTVTDTQDTTVEPQDTIVGAQDTTVEPQDTIIVGTQDITVEPQDTVTDTPQDTIVGTQDTTVEPQDTIVGTQDTTVEPQDTIVGTQDTTVEPQDLTMECRDNFETTASTSDSNYATDGPPLVDNNNIAKNLNTSLDNSDGTV